jgi:FEZ-like protein
MTITQLNDLYMEMEVLIREFSETLISELALRDELEYEKELKNTFISLLLAVQNKRRQFHVEKKKGKMQTSMTSSTQSLNGQNGITRPNGLGVSTSSLDPKYLTTVIPYHLDAGPPENQALQVLIKSKINLIKLNYFYFYFNFFSVLKAINEDSPTVPTLLTDYILKVLCPT